MVEENKTVSENAGGEETKAKSGKGGMKKWVLAGGLVVLLAGGGVAAWKFFLSGHGGEVVATTGEEGAQGHGEAPDVHGSGETGPLLELSPFIVNLADPVETRYLKITINLEVRDSATEEIIKHRMPQIRDAILVLLTSKTSEELRTVEGKFQLREEIIHRVNQLLPNRGVKGAYYTEFVMQ